MPSGKDPNIPTYIFDSCLIFRFLGNLPILISIF